MLSAEPNVFLAISRKLGPLREPLLVFGVLCVISLLTFASANPDISLDLALILTVIVIIAISSLYVYLHRNTPSTRREQQYRTAVRSATKPTQDGENDIEQ